MYNHQRKKNTECLHRHKRRARPRNEQLPERNGDIRSCCFLKCHNSHHHCTPPPSPRPSFFSDRGKAEPSTHEFKSPDAATHSHSTSSTLQPFAAVVWLTLSRCAAFYLVVTLGYQRGNRWTERSNRNLFFFFYPLSLPLDTP